MAMSKGAQGGLGWLAALTVPVVLALAAVRLVLSPWFVEFEYRTPGFPEDDHGFSQQERIAYAQVAREYLVNDADISFLGDLRFPEGEQAPPSSCRPPDDCTRLYNDRELRHMQDVKGAIRITLWVLDGGLLLLICLGIWAWRAGWSEAYRKGLRRGGLLTLALIAIIIVLVVVAWNFLFIGFHQMFFESGTWSFPTSDTLIRLFPERFWQDTFMMVGGLTAGMGLILYLLFRRK